MKQQPPLPTLNHPLLSLKQLRKAVGGAHRLQALNRRNPEDRLDAILGQVLVEALEARDTRTCRAAQAIGWYARMGSQEFRWHILHLNAAHLLQLIVTLSPQASTLPKFKRLVREWGEQAHRRDQAQQASHVADNADRAQNSPE